MHLQEGIRNGGYLTQPRTADGRFAKRRKTNIPACIVASGMEQALACVVRDTSSSGALIELRAPVGRPSETWRLGDVFTLVMPRELVQFNCRVAWREDRMIGVQFVGPSRTYAKPASARIAPRPQAPKSLVGKLFGR